MKVRRLTEFQGGLKQRFNSRTREGATRGVSRKIGLQGCFNSRTREGATTGEKAELLERVVSIHAPVKVRLYST